METHGNHRLLETHGNPWKPHLWKPIETHGNIWTPSWKPMAIVASETRGNPWKPMETTFMETYRNLWKHMDTFMETHGNCCI
jgi:hypothetical protein